MELFDFLFGPSDADWGTRDAGKAKHRALLLQNEKDAKKKNKKKVKKKEKLIWQDI